MRKDSEWFRKEKNEKQIYMVCSDSHCFISLNLNLNDVKRFWQNAIHL